MTRKSFFSSLVLQMLLTGMLGQQIFRKRFPDAIRILCLSLLFGTTVLDVWADEFSVRHLSNEQNIVSMQTSCKYLLLPVQDNASEGKISYDAVSAQFVMERSESGLTSFSKDFPAMTVVPVLNMDEFDLRIFVDRSSIEVFGEEGKYVMTNRVFPSAPYNKMKFESVRGSYTVKSLNVYKLH